MKVYIVMIVAWFGAVSIGFAQDDPVEPTGSWARRGPGAQPFEEAGSASDGTFLYFVGETVQRFDPILRAWITLPPLAAGLRENTCAALDGKLYSIGGTPASTLGCIHSYDLRLGAGGSWSLLDSNLTNHQRLSACAVARGKIYIVGGTNGTTALRGFSVFNPADATVSAVGQAPYAMMSLYMAYVPAVDRLFVIGGSNGSQMQSGCFQYNLDTNQWTAVANLPVASQGGISWVHANRIYITGGMCIWTQSTLEYSPFADTWTRRADTVLRQWFPGGGKAAGKIFLYGGSWPQQLEKFTPPDFGQPPAAANVVQIGHRGDLPQGEWTGPRITLSADVTDADAGQDVRFEVQVKPSAAPDWDRAMPFATTSGPQGRHSIDVVLPAAGDYDWRYRVADSNDIFSPVDANGTTLWAEFNSNSVSPDFRSDQIAPAAVVPYFATGDVVVQSLESGPVEFGWSAGADDGPINGLTYEFLITDAATEVLVERQPDIAWNSPRATATLAVSRRPYHWRVRSVDVGGNTGPWTPPMEFRVIGHDGVDHAAGDAKRVCGFGASATPAAGFLLAVFLYARPKR